MKHILLHAAVVALTLASAAAWAGRIEAGDRFEMAAVLHAAITPARAVSIAEQGGGRAYGYGMEANGRGHWYDVDVLRGGAPLQLRIDASTGRVLGSSAARGEDTQGAHALDAGGLTLGGAIAAAERAGKGPALEAGAVGAGATAHIDVDVIEDHGRRIAHYRISKSGGRLKVGLIGSDT